MCEEQGGVFYRGRNFRLLGSGLIDKYPFSGLYTDTKVDEHKYTNKKSSEQELV